MSEQSSEALNFGPQWIRDLSNGTSVSVPPASPGPNCKLAQFRYGKEEMLALFSKSHKPPNVNEDVADFILKKEVSDPLALMPLTEEEQHNSFGSLNSLAVLKMMGRGGQRGGKGMSRGGRGSGRGRGEAGFYRGFSQDDSSSNTTDDGWQRTDSTSRKQSWGESSGRGFADRITGKENETSPRGYETTGSSGRHSRALASGNWRSSETDDDGGGWVVSRGSERAERWRTSSRDNWQREDHARERRYSDRDRNGFDDLPEWSKSDNVFEPDSGSFDATGAFCVAKDKKPPDDSGGGCPEDWDLEIAEDKHTDETKCDVFSKDSEISQNDQGKESQSNDEVQEETNDDISCVEDYSQPTVDEKTGVTTPEPRPLSPGGEHNIQKEMHSDEVGDNLVRVAESCIANLDVESEECSGEKLSSSSEQQGGAIETKWFYRDPQGQEQGPFSNEEMVEWFHHGYFTMQLSVRRHCDNVYLTLGDLIKRWQRVPFMPGPSPPPITHHQVISEQTLFMQQQLLQQHYQHLQKQAILQQIQQQQQLQQEQRQQAAESLQLNFNTSDHEPSRTVVSPRSHPTTTHSSSSVAAAEIIWGAERQSPKGTWSPTENMPTHTYEAERQASPVEDVQKREREIQEEQERKRLEMEKAEMLRQKVEEEKRQRMKKQEERLRRIEEERREQEIQKAEEEKRKLEEEKRKLEEAKKKQHTSKEEQSQWRGKGGMGRGKLYEMMEKEGRVGKKQRHEQEEEKIKELVKKNGEREHQRKSQKYEGEKRKQDEENKRSKPLEKNMNEELPRHQRHFVEVQEDEWENEVEERSTKKKETSQQTRSKSNGSSRQWLTQSTTAMSLSEIQEQEEKSRLAYEEKMRELQQTQLQQSAASSGWSAERVQASSKVKSLKVIQNEQARQTSKHNKQAPHSQTSQISTAWNMAWTAGNNNVWIGNHNEQEEQDTEYCDDVIRGHNPGKVQTQTVKNNAVKQTKQSTTKPVTNGKKSGNKTSKEEESVRKIFQQSASNDPFTEWCTQSLHGLPTGVDVPTFIAFLKELQSPYEIQTYVREYIGDSNEAKCFAKEFIERRRSSEWKHVPTKTTSTTSKQSTSSSVVARGGVAAPRAENDSSGNKIKKKKKQRMQKVDPSILGFSVNAAERVNMGEIQSVDDS